MKKTLSLIIAGVTALNLLSFTVTASESPFPPEAAKLTENSFQITNEPEKLEYVIGEELDFSGIYITHFVEVSYELVSPVNGCMYLDEQDISEDFADISEKPETIPYSDLIAHPDIYPIYYYVDTTDFNNQEAGTYEIRLYCYIATTDKIVCVSDSFNVTVTDGLMGDIDGDKTVSISDATEVLTYYAQSAAGLEPESISNADIDVDGEITIQDATYILSYYARNGAGISCTWEEILAEE